MKLHDHPQMEIISYLLQGQMKVNLYTHLSDCIYRRERKTLQKGDYSLIDGCRDSHNNLHEFVAVEPSYFIDIIFPDYDVGRPCRFFEEISEID